MKLLLSTGAGGSELLLNINSSKIVIFIIIMLPSMVSEV